MILKYMHENVKIYDLPGAKTNPFPTSLCANLPK